MSENSSESAVRSHAASSLMRLSASRNIRKSASEMSVSLTAGTSDDYAFSRHFADATRSKVYGFTIEWGRDSNPTPFHPPYSEMKQIITEVTAGLLEFCIQAS